MERRTVSTVVSAMPILAAVLVLGTAVSMCWALSGVQWQPGFPMRAGSQVLLMWLPVPGAESYAVLRRDLGTKEERRWPVRGTQFVDAEAASDRSFLYTVQAMMGGGVPGPTSEVVKLEGFRPLKAPKWVGNYQEGRGIHLAWEAVEGAAFYNLYRAGAGQELSLLASVQNVTYVDGEVKVSGKYVYAVRAVGLQSQESPSSEALLVEVTGGAAAADGPALQHLHLSVAARLHETDQYRLREPTDVAIVDGAVLTTDLGSRSVLALDLDGVLLYRFGMRPPEYVGEWGIPWGLGAGPEGRRTALTFLRSRNVRVFGRQGDLLQDWPLPNPPGYEDDPRVPQPMDVAVDAAGGLWVSDYTFAQIVHLDERGRERGRVGTPRGEKDFGPFRSPTFLAYDAANNRLFAVDSLLAQVFVIGMDGAIQARWGRPRAPEGALNLPKGITVTRDGEVLVVDGIRSSLQTFTPEGVIRAVYYSPDLEYLDLRGLVSVAEDPKTGELYALSKVDSTVYRLSVSREP
ncbi:MAG: hypothetical protein P1P84_13530 [Deferrisomatales bacterium]|nr:hypothetical protein [Deferrisomatales bacterium]